MTAAELVAPLGVSKNTAASKAAEIRKDLKINLFSTEWMLQAYIEKNVTIHG